MKILITGSCGFIGSNFINSLLDNDMVEEIRGIDNLSHGTKLKGIHDHPKVNQYIADICDKNTKSLYEDIDYVFHFAGLVSIYDCDKHPYEAINNNVMGTVNVLEACVKYGIKKIIAPETSAVYEDCGEGPYSESQMNPHSIYGTSKAMSGLLIKSFQKTRNLDYTLLRFFNVYGELQDWKRTVPPASAGFAIRLMQGKKPIIFGNAERRRDFIHVNDIISFMDICIHDNRTNNETYNLGTGQTISLIEMIEKIADIIGVEYDGYENVNEIVSEAFTIFANIDKAKQVGWQPSITFEEGHTSLIQALKILYKEGIFPTDFMDNINVKKLK